MTCNDCKHAKRIGPVLCCLLFGRKATTPQRADCFSREPGSDDK